jgi:hypothetical protein
MKLLGIVLFLGLSLHFISCTPQQKLPNYLEKVSDSTMRADVQVPELRIQKSDLLSIQVYSASTKPEISDAIFQFAISIDREREPLHPRDIWLI